MTTPPTCGTLFHEALQQHTDMSPAQIRLFAAGFVTSAAEKIALGACPAAMFRPSAEHQIMLMDLCRQTAARYGLRWFVLGSELWLYDPHVDALMDLLEDLQDVDEPSPAWHALRALLCGIPASQIDLAYHQRPGHGAPCDRPSTEKEHVSRHLTGSAGRNRRLRGRTP